MHDAFISYATEDNDFASEIAYGLRGNGLKIWFAPLSLRVGDKLLGSIESGLRNSRAGVIIVSSHYLSKQWTSFEMLGVGRPQVESKSLALAGIIAITDTSPVNHVTSRLIEVLSEGAPSRGIIPVWEDPARRFLKGLGEVNLTNGQTTTIFEFVLYTQDSDFPFWLAGQSYTKQDLLYKVAEIFAYNPNRMVNWLDKDAIKALRQMCVENGFDPDGREF